ncbi:B12-binding domain-containing radical SAM protein [bacterium]|nr:B12-binding domain-containing radical SAM protein [candidate division CSSED10-310 bacterium]
MSHRHATIPGRIAILMRILMINPSRAGRGSIPINLPILIAVLRRAGHDVRLFDYTNYHCFQPENMVFSPDGSGELPTGKFAHPEHFFKPVSPIDLAALKMERTVYAERLQLLDVFDPGSELWHSDPDQDLKVLIERFRPDVVGMSCLTMDAGTALRRIAPFKDKHGFVLVVGGVHARVVPESVIQHPVVDAVCVGEGERAFPEYLSRLASGVDWEQSPNMWIRSGDSWRRNDVVWRTEMADLPVPELDLFDPVHFYRPFDGRLFRMVNFEWSRGCPFSCSYCVNAVLNQQTRTLFPHASLVRTKPVEQTIAELRLLIDRHGFDFIRFWDEDFLAVPVDTLSAFARVYLRDIGLPFLIYARLESITRDKLALLKRIGCRTIAAGIESGSEWIRRHVLNRQIGNQMILDRLGMIQEAGIRVSCYNIMGLPGENRERIFETIQLNRQAPVDSVSCTLLEPYPRTPIRSLCEKDGFEGGLEPDYRCLFGIPNYVPRGMTCSELMGLFRCFPLYVYLPEDDFPRIRIAEQDTEEGRAMFQSLMREKMESYNEKPLYPR